jgi:hypothetical protein
MLPTPIVHNNGTGAQSLVEQSRTVYQLLQQAMDAMAKARPHGRDYYTSEDPDAFVKARAAHDVQMVIVHNVAERYCDYALAIQKAAK